MLGYVGGALLDGGEHPSNKWLDGNAPAVPGGCRVAPGKAKRPQPAQSTPFASFSRFGLVPCLGGARTRQAGVPRPTGEACACGPIHARGSGASLAGLPAAAAVCVYAPRPLCTHGCGLAGMQAHHLACVSSRSSVWPSHLLSVVESPPGSPSKTGPSAATLLPPLPAWGSLPGSDTQAAATDDDYCLLITPPADL